MLKRTKKRDIRAKDAQIRAPEDNTSELLMLGCRKLAASVRTADGQSVVAHKRLTGIPTIHPFDTGEFVWIVESNHGNLIMYGHDDGVSLHPGPTDTKLDHGAAFHTLAWDDINAAAAWAEKCKAEVAAVELLHNAKIQDAACAIFFERLVGPDNTPGFVLSTDDNSIYLVAFGQGGAVLLNNPPDGQPQERLADLALEELMHAHNAYCERNPTPPEPDAS